ncbi:MAG: transporter [Deltaproteobacteria bacterium SG8_13]|nr:MAG: transporter [Deltaproteobacteria bacterium SG8_13]
MQIFNTIIPIFAIILLGLFARRKGYIPPEFLVPANRLVYYLAIPALVFSAISKASLRTQFNFATLALTLAAVISIFIVAWLWAVAGRYRQGALATFVQGSIHGNLGYVGLAVAFYYLGNEGFIRASIIAGFLMILQNLLSITILQMYGGTTAKNHRWWQIVWKVAGNPVILAAILGILFSLFDIPVPVIVERSLKILSSMALPTALLIIGASLSLKLLKSSTKSVISISVLKLLLLPAVGLSTFHLLGIAAADFLPALILLASPTATVAYVMAREMSGDTDMAVAAISGSTLLSAITFIFWLQVAG